MNLNITGKQITVGPRLKKHVEENLKNNVSRYFADVIKSNVSFSKEGPLVKVDLSVHPVKGIMLNSSAEGVDAYSVFDEANDKLSTRLRRYKRRLTDSRSKMGVSEAVSLAIIAPEINEDEPELPEETENNHAIIAEMESEVPLCSVSGAVMRMDLSDTNALLFRNSATNNLNMVYRRKDGNIGWVDPSQIKNK